MSALLACALTGVVQAQTKIPSSKDSLVVVELFQSQGCSSCPPAEANLNAIAGDANVLALSYGVTYWDDLGWKDTFARQSYTDRQWAYARHHRRGTVWTPQVYINGGADIVGNDRAQLDAAIGRVNVGASALSWHGDRLAVAKANAPVACDVWLVRYDPRTLHVAIGSGENGGRTLPQRNVVRELIHLGSWDGTSQSFVIPPASLPGLRTAALLQVADGGEIIAASRQHDAL